MKKPTSLLQTMLQELLSELWVMDQHQQDVYKLMCMHPLHEPQREFKSRFTSAMGIKIPNTITYAEPGEFREVVEFMGQTVFPTSSRLEEVPCPQELQAFFKGVAEDICKSFQGEFESGIQNDKSSCDDVPQGGQQSVQDEH